MTLTSEEKRIARVAILVYVQQFVKEVAPPLSQTESEHILNYLKLERKIEEEL